GFLVFIGPAAIVGHAVTLEERCVVKTRVVDQDENGLALDVQTGVVVPAVFRGDDAKTGKYNGRIVQLDQRVGVLSGENIVVYVVQLEGRLRRLDLQRGIAHGRDLYQGHVLEV